MNTGFVSEVDLGFKFLVGNDQTVAEQAAIHADLVRSRKLALWFFVGRLFFYTNVAVLATFGSYVKFAVPLYCPHTSMQPNTHLALGQRSELLLEVGVYKCGNSLHFSDLGSSFVHVPQQTWTRYFVRAIPALHQAGIFWFDWLGFGNISIKLILNDPKRFGGFNAQDFVLQGLVRCDRRQDLPLRLWIAFGEPLPGRGRSFKHLGRSFEAALAVLPIVAENGLKPVPFL